MTRWVRKPEREMHGWKLGGRLALLFEDNDDELDDDNGPEDFRYFREYESGRFHLRSKRKIGSVSLSSSPSPKKKSNPRERKKLAIVRRAMMSKKKFRMVIEILASELGMEARSTVHWRQSKFATTMNQRKQTPRSSKWKEITNVLFEIGLLMRARKGMWHERCKLVRMKPPIIFLKNNSCGSSGGYDLRSQDHPSVDKHLRLDHFQSFVCGIVHLV